MATSNKTIYLCFHCGNRFLSPVKLCKDCSTKEKREAMDEENRKAWAESKKKFVCSYCEK